MVQLNKTLLLLGFILTTFASQAIWVTFSPVVTLASEELGVSVELVGYLAVTYPLFFLLLTVPSGILLDRNLRFWLFFGTFMTFLGGAGRLIFYQNYYWLLICQLFSAIGQPFLLNGFVSFASNIFEEKRTGVISLLSLSMYLGTVFALAVGLDLYRAGGIFALILPPALISLLGFILFAVSMRAVQAVGGAFEARNLVEVTKRKDLWIVGIILGLGVATFDNLATWLQPALKSAGLEDLAGDAVALSIILGLIGVAIIPGLISSRNLRTSYIRSVIPTITIFFAILSMHQSEILIFSFLGLSGLLMLPAYPLIMDWIGVFHEKSKQGSATGFVGLVSRAISVALMFIAPLFIHEAGEYFLFITAVVALAFIFSIMLPDDRKIEKIYS